MEKLTLETEEEPQFTG